MTTMRPINLTRDLLAKFLPDPRLIREFENLALNNGDVGETINSIIAAPLLGIVVSDTFTNDRYLDAGVGITLFDGGAKNALTIGLANSGVAAGVYGLPTAFPQITVDSRGRVTFAAQITLNADNVAEGVANLYFTQDRARLALSAGDGIDYDNTTGEIAAKSAGAAPALTPYIAPTISNPPTQAEVQALADAQEASDAALSALISLLQANGNLT